MRLLLDTKGESSFPILGLGIDTQMAIAIYRVGQDAEYAEVCPPNLIVFHSVLNCIDHLD